MSATSSAPCTSNSRTLDLTAVPPRWLDCPRKSSIIADRFIAFKTPLDDRYKEKINGAQRWTCKMLIDNVRSSQKKLGLVIDLTNTDRFYQGNVEFREEKIRYEKIRCRGHGETPNDEQIQHFIDTCNDFIRTNSDDIIGVHCTHGFNRTGFLICACLYREHGMSIDVAIRQFAESRTPGIYKQDYLNKLMEKYGNDRPTPISAPARPEWCLTNSDDEDESYERPTTSGSNKRSRSNNSSQRANKQFQDKTRTSDPQFAVRLSGVTPVREQPSADDLQFKCQQMCHWNGRGFPGSQPVSMDYTNYMTIVQSPYMVSWKADGTRYLMLIEDEEKVYMFDRDNNVFAISNVRFPKYSDCSRHLKDTLVDGELVLDIIDKDKNIQIPRFLIYDIVTYDGEDVSTRPLRERLRLIDQSIIGVRNEAISRCLINKTLEPFSIRSKAFYELSAVAALTVPGSEFLRNISHNVDGLIFQPELDPYKPGRCPRVFKWKEDNTMDFLLKIIEYKRVGQLPEKKACLLINQNGKLTECASMRYSRDLRQYDNKIIECSYRNSEWHILRQRTDKSFPNDFKTAEGVCKALRTPITKEIICDLIQKHARNQSQHVNSQSTT